MLPRYLADIICHARPVNDGDGSESAHASRNVLLMNVMLEDLDIWGESSGIFSLSGLMRNDVQLDTHLSLRTNLKISFKSSSSCPSSSGI